MYTHCRSNPGRCQLGHIFFWVADFTASVSDACPNRLPTTFRQALDTPPASSLQFMKVCVSVVCRIPDPCNASNSNPIHPRGINKRLPVLHPLHTPVRPLTSPQPLPSSGLPTAAGVTNSVKKVITVVLEVQAVDFDAQIGQLRRRPPLSPRPPLGVSTNTKRFLFLCMYPFLNTTHCPVQHTHFTIFVLFVSKKTS